MRDERQELAISNLCILSVAALGMWFWNEDQEKLHDVGSELQDKSREAKLVLHPILFRRTKARLTNTQHTHSLHHLQL